MKKKILLLALSLASPAFSTIRGYYPGNSGDGFNPTLGDCGDPLNVNGTVAQPASPAPPEGDQWLAHPNSGSGNSFSIPNSFSPCNNMVQSDNGSFVFYYRQSAAPVSDQVIFRLSGGPAGFELLHTAASTIDVINPTTDDVLGSFPISDNVDYYIEQRWSSASNYYRVFINYFPVTNIAWPSHSSTFAGAWMQGDSTGYMDALMVSDDPTEVYPGPIAPTPTITPTFSISPTFSVSPTSTITPTASPTPSGTPSATPTPAVLPPTNVRVGTLQPNSTISLFWDINATVTKWLVFFNGAQAYEISKSQVTVPTPGTYSYLMQNLPPGAAIVLTMTAQSPGKPASPPSLSAVFNTSAAPFSYVVPLGISGEERFTTTGAGKVYPSSMAVRSYSIAVCGEGGSLNSWSVTLQGSLDGVHFTTILTHDNGTTECTGLSTGASFYPYSFVRANCGSLDLGAAADALVNIIGTP